MQQEIRSDIQFQLLNKQTVGTQTTYKFVCSDSKLNRNGWKILTSGIKMDNYKKNPLFLMNHENHNYPIGKCTNLYVENDQLIGEFIFHELDDRSKLAKKLVDEGYLNSVSIGCIILKKGTPEPIKPEDKDKYGFWRESTQVFEEVDLTEISLVGIPANVDAKFLEKINNSFKNGVLSQNEYNLILGREIKSTHPELIKIEQQLNDMHNRVDTLIANTSNNKKGASTMTTESQNNVKTDINNSNSILVADAKDYFKNGVTVLSVDLTMDAVDDIMDNEELTDAQKKAELQALQLHLKNQYSNNDNLRLQNMMRIVDDILKNLR